MKKIIIFLLISISILTQNRILIISSYHDEFKWQEMYKKAFIETLGEDYEYFYFNMDTKRLPKSTFETKGKEAYEYFLELNPSLVLLGDDNALLYMKDYLYGLDIPVVFLGINANIRDYIGGDRKNITGVLERPLFKQNIRLLEDLLGDIDNVLILFDQTYTVNRILKEEFNNKGKITLKGIDVFIRSTNDYDQWKSIVDNAHKDYDAIIFGTYQGLRDNDNKSVYDQDAINYARNNSQIPIFAFWEFGIGKNKALGGLVLTGEEQGIAAANIAKEVLEEGRSPNLIFPTTPNEGRYIFSQSEILKWALEIDEDIAKKSLFYE